MWVCGEFGGCSSSRRCREFRLPGISLVLIRLELCIRLTSFRFSLRPQLHRLLLWQNIERFNIYWQGLARVVFEYWPLKLLLRSAVRCDRVVPRTRFARRAWASRFRRLGSSDLEQSAVPDLRDTSPSAASLLRQLKTELFVRT